MGQKSKHILYGVLFNIQSFGFSLLCKHKKTHSLRFTISFTCHPKIVQNMCSIQPLIYDIIELRKLNNKIGKTIEKAHDEVAGH